MLTEKDINEERGVVLEEYRLGLGAEDRMRKIYFPKLVEGSLYADRIPIGKENILKTFKPETIRSFYHDWYRPDLEAVVIVGDIDVATAKKMLEEHFAGLKNPAKERERKYATITPRKAPEAMVVKDKEATNSRLIISFPYEKKHYQTTLADYKEELKRDLVTQIMNQHLNDLTQGSNPPFLGAGIGFDDFIKGYDGLEALAIFGAGGTEKALNALTAELERSKKFGFTDGDLERAKKEILSGEEQKFNERKTTESKEYVDEYVNAFMDKEPFPGIENEYSYVKMMLPEIKLADINGLVAKWMANPNTFTLVTGPDKSDVQFPSDKELLAMTKKGFSQEVTKQEEKAVASSLLETKPTPGKVVSQTKEDGFDAVTYTLSNGVQVTIKPTEFKSDEILMTAVKKGGSGQYNVDDKSNVNFATAVVESMGAGDFTPADLDKVTAGKEIRVNASITNTDDDISASSTVKDFESMLQLMYLKLEKTRKDESLFQAFKDKSIQQLQFMSANPQFAFQDTVLKVLYNNNPLANGIPKKADFDKINLDRALEIYHNELGDASGYHFFIVGNIKPEAALPLIETYIGGLPSSNKPVSFKDNGVRRITGNKVVTVRKGSEKKSMVMKIYWGEVPFSEDLSLKAQALTEVINLKVIEELRERMSAIYSGGFSANVAKEPYQYFTIQTRLPCGPENVQKVVDSSTGIIEAIKTNGPETKDLDKVKTQWHEKHLIDMKENKYWANKMESVIFWGNDKDRVLNYDNYINKLTPAEIQETAKKLFDGKNEFVALLYPESDK